MAEPGNALKLRTDSPVRQLTDKQGKVTAKFNTSFDVRVEDYLLNFNLDKQALHPLGILIGDAILKRSRTNQKVNISATKIRVGKEEFQLDFAFSPPEAETKKSAVLDQNIKSLRRTLKLAEHHSVIQKTLFTDEMPQFAGEKLTLSQGLQKFIGRLTEPKVNLKSFFSLFGSGSGLTPAWDDFCSGALLADRWLGNNRLEVSADLFQELKSETTLTSWWQLKLAARGKSTLEIENLVVKILTGKVRVADCLNVTNTGHTSGADILSGLTVYLSRSPIDKQVLYSEQTSK